MKSDQSRVVPSSDMTGVFISRGNRDTQREEGHVQTGAEIGEMLPHVKEDLGPPEAGGGKGGFFPRGFRGNMALPTLWFQTCSLQKL